MKTDDLIRYWAHMLDEAMGAESGASPAQDFVFFWGCGSKSRVQKGCLSQWWPCRFEVDGVEYNCAEQYMMAEKARLFGDGEMLDAILGSSSPKDIKAYGRRVRGFDPAKWAQERYDVVVRGNTAKFSQNPELKSFLLSTGEAELVEASPKDRIWGIGLAEGDPRSLDRSKWPGQNLLGKALMEVRHRLNSGKTIVTESYAITPGDNDIWSRAGHFIKMPKLAANLKDHGLTDPLFINKDFERTEWYANDKADKVDCYTVIKLNPSVNLCDITNPADIESLGIIPVYARRIAKIFQTRETYFSLNRNTYAYTKLHLAECERAIECYIKAFDQVAAKFNGIPSSKFETFYEKLKCDFNAVFTNQKAKISLNKNAYHEFELAFDNYIDNAVGDYDLLRGYLCLFLSLNKFLCGPGKSMLGQYKKTNIGAGTDFLQFAFYCMIASRGYDGYFCREIDRTTLAAKYDTVTLFKADKIMSIKNFPFNSENKSSQYYRMRLKYSPEFQQQVVAQRQQAKEQQAEWAKQWAEKVAQAKKEQTKKEQDEKKWADDVQAEKDAQAERDRIEKERTEIAQAEKAQAEKAFADECLRNYMEWCHETQPKLWRVRFGSPVESVSYGVFVVGGDTEQQAYAEADAFCKKCFPAAALGGARKKLEDDARSYPVWGSANHGVIDVTARYVKSEKSYEALFKLALVPTRIELPRWPENKYTAGDYTAFSDAVWFKLTAEYDAARGRSIWKRTGASLLAPR